MSRRLQKKGIITEAELLEEIEKIRKKRGGRE